MNKLDHHDTISYVIYADYCRLDKRFKDAIKWAMKDIDERSVNRNMTLLLRWAIYAEGN